MLHYGMLHYGTLRYRSSCFVTFRLCFVSLWIFADKTFLFLPSKWFTWFQVFHVNHPSQCQFSKNKTGKTRTQSHFVFFNISPWWSQTGECAMFPLTEGMCHTRYLESRAQSTCFFLFFLVKPQICSDWGSGGISYHQSGCQAGLEPLPPKGPSGGRSVTTHTLNSLLCLRSTGNSANVRRHSK